MQISDNGFPRRIRTDLFVPAERAIATAVDAVEATGAHPRLTDAVVLLGQAREAVADAVEAMGLTYDANLERMRESLRDDPLAFAIAAQMNRPQSQTEER